MSSLYQFQIDSKGQRYQQYRFKNITEQIIQFQCEGQIGILMYNNCEIEIMNLLTLDAIMKLNNTNTKMKISNYCSCSLVHLLPVDRLQFDCVPTFESSDYYLWI
jgi:hypothetical protein